MKKTIEKIARIEMPGVQTRLNANEEQALLRVLREANSLSMGSECEAFEKEFAAFTGCGDAVVVNSCSSALELAAILSGLGADDEVIIPAHTFCATAVPFGRTGATIQWVDIDPNSRLISAESIRSQISDRTTAIVVVHLYGLSANMDEILALAKEFGIQVIEDCAQAPGGRYQGRRLGSLGDFGCFSFHSHKNITTLGEGGMLTVRNPEHATTARRLRWMGNWPFQQRREQYWQPAMGDVVEPMPGRWPANYCMGEPNAAVGRLLLQRLDAINEQRRAQARRFIEAFQEFPELVFQTVPEGCEHIYHLMVARYDGEAYGMTRNDLMEILHEQLNVKCLVHYWPLNRSDLFQKFGFDRAHVPETDRFFDNMIGFPWWSDMSDETIDDMAQRTCWALEQLRSGSLS